MKTADYYRQFLRNAPKWMQRSLLAVDKVARVFKEERKAIARFIPDTVQIARNMKCQFKNRRGQLVLMRRHQFDPQTQTCNRCGAYRPHIRRAKLYRGTVTPKQMTAAAGKS